MSRHYFSNGTEYQMWQARWCDRCEFDHDAHLDRFGGCDLVTAMYLGDDRPELVAHDALPVAHLSCTKFTECGACGVAGSVEETPQP